MKSALLRRKELAFIEPVQIVPSDTSHEHLQRVEEWTQKSTGAPPSNRKHSAKEQENHDLEAKSQLIAEAVQLLDTRDKQTRTKTPPATHIQQHATLESDGDSDEHNKEKEKESHEHGIGKKFRESNLSARNYIKHFEGKMTRKKAYENAILSTYPSIKSKKDLRKGLTTIPAPPPPVAGPATPVEEPASWRFKASRSVKFAIRSGSQQRVFKEPEEASEQGDKWEAKQDNDPDWWRWKLKQRFLQNDELLHKLASQRQKLETAMAKGENSRINRISISTKKDFNLSTRIEEPSVSPVATIRNSSWHIGVEIPSHMAPSINSSKRSATSSILRTNTYQTKARDPIPNFYIPSKKVVSAVLEDETDNDDQTPNSEKAARQKLKVLKKDPYLSKLLAGNEMFKPEIMLEDNQQNNKNQLTQQHKNTSGNNVRRKLSLESLTDDDDDEAIAAKFFNPDIKVLYERLSEMEVLNNDLMAKSKVLADLNSKEPSDGFLNLPILLETGRFSHYNKLPSMKIIDNINKDGTSKQQNKKYEKSTKLQNVLNKMKKSHHLTSMKLAHALISDGNAPTTPIPNQGKIEDLPTGEWAKKLMSSVKKQDIGTKTEDDGNSVEISRKGDEINDIFNLQQRKYKVPIDQETNLLYHEILMSKWKKDKHNKEKDIETGRGNKGVGNVKWKRVDHGHDKKKMDEDLNRPRGLDIWLENIREKAKRDRLISPLPNNTDATNKRVPVVPKSSTDKSTIKTIFAQHK